MPADLSPIDKAKFVAAKRAVAYVESGMKLGLGTGSTAAWMVRCLADSTGIRSNGHAWCTASDNQCVGNDIEPTRCADCDHAVVGRRHAPLYRGLYDHLKEVTDRDDIGPSGQALVQRDRQRCRSVLAALGQDPEEA